jgi:hypothetical protein
MIPTAGDEFAQLVASGKVIVAEIGKAAPNATTFHFQEDASHLVTVNSGLIEFLDAVARALFRATTVYKETTVPPEGDIDDVIGRLADLFCAWQAVPGSEESAIDPTRIPLPPQAGSSAALLAAESLRFILAHELGHVRSAVLTKSTTALSRDQEFEADAAGVNLLLATGIQQRMAFAGSVVALRALAVLQSMGHVFAGTHPPPLDRLGALFKAVRGFVPDPLDYCSISTIASSFDEMMDQGNMRRLGHMEGAALTVDRIVARLYGALIECLNRGFPSPEALGQMFLNDIHRTPPDMLPVLAAATTRLFYPTIHARMSYPGLPRMREIYFGLLPGLPEPARTIFQTLADNNLKEK